MSTIELNGVTETPAAAASTETKNALTVQPRNLIANIDPHTYVFKTGIKKPEKPKGVVERGDQYEYEKDKDGNFIKKASVDPVTGKTKMVKVPVLDADGNKVVKRKRKGSQVCAIELQRCAKAIKSREKAIANAEKKLAAAKTPAAVEIAKERLILAIIKRDYTVERLDKMLTHAKEHNGATLKAHSEMSDDDKKTASKGKLILATAHDKILHLDKVRGDLLLTAKIQAEGSSKDQAFEELRGKYKWIVNSWAKPGKTPLETDDAQSRGIQGLWDAALRFDANRAGENGKFAIFSTVAYRWVHRNTRARTKADAKPGQYKIGTETKHLVSIDGQVNSDNETTEFTLASTASLDISNSMKMDVADAMSSLNAVQQLVLKYRYFDGLKVEDIAKIMKLPVPQVRSFASEANRVLQDRLSAYGN